MTEININEVIKLVNEEGIYIKDAAQKYNISAKTLQRKLNSAGYKYNRTTKQYESIESETVVNYVVNETERTNRTYKIDNDVLDALAFMAINEKVEQQDIVNRALKAFIDEKYFSLFVD